eukprot:m.246969 g.246969  ORF g.246969 m.246969 type:complete len:281 (-) comp75641_c0_seq1:47-889(-)
MIGMNKERGFERTPEQYEELWNPKIEVNGAIGIQCLLGPNAAWNFKDAKTGRMKYTQRYEGTINIDMNLEKFPFDKTAVHICLGCEFYGGDKVILKIDDDWDRLTPVKSKLRDWTLVPKQVVFEEKTSIATSTKSYSNVDYIIPISRKYMFYIYKVIVINLIMLIWSWVVFWMDHDAIGDRMSISITMFLASVAFVFVISDKLPKVEFLTVLDKMLLFVFVSLFLSAVESFVVYVSLDNGNSTTASKNIELAARIGFPAVTVLFFVFHAVRSILATVEST